MLKKIGEPAPPKGFKLMLFRAPIFLYRLGLGFLFGERFIRLKHWGRVSGELKETIIEVIEQDKPSGKLYAASGYGAKSQWFKNIVANDNVFITLKNDEHEAQARILPEMQAEEVLLRYAAAHRNSIKAVAKLSGYELEGDKQDIIDFSRIVKIVEFNIAHQK